MAQTHFRPERISDRPVRLESDGETQIIRLPDDVHFDGEMVYLSRDDRTGDVILTQRAPKPVMTWDELFAMFDAADVPEDFMADRPLNGHADPRGVFDDELS